MNLRPLCSDRIRIRQSFDKIILKEKSISISDPEFFLLRIRIRIQRLSTETLSSLVVTTSRRQGAKMWIFDLKIISLIEMFILARNLIRFDMFFSLWLYRISDLFYIRYPAGYPVSFTGYPTRKRKNSFDKKIISIYNIDM